MLEKIIHFLSSKKKQSSNWLNIGQQSTNILKTPKGTIKTTYDRLVGTHILFFFLFPFVYLHVWPFTVFNSVVMGNLTE